MEEILLIYFFNLEDTFRVLCVGTLAHLGERAIEARKVGGSSPPSPKIF